MNPGMSQGQSLGIPQSPSTATVPPVAPQNPVRPSQSRGSAAPVNAGRQSGTQVAGKDPGFLKRFVIPAVIGGALLGGAIAACVAFPLFAMPIAAFCAAVAGVVVIGATAAKLAEKIPYLILLPFVKPALDANMNLTRSVIDQIGAGDSVANILSSIPASKARSRLEKAKVFKELAGLEKTIDNLVTCSKKGSKQEILAVAKHYLDSQLVASGVEDPNNRGSSSGDRATPESIKIVIQDVHRKLISAELDEDLAALRQQQSGGAGGNAQASVTSSGVPGHSGPAHTGSSQGATTPPPAVPSLAPGATASPSGGSSNPNNLSAPPAVPPTP